MVSVYVRLVKPLSIGELEERIRGLELVASEWDITPDLIRDEDGNHYTTLIHEFYILRDELEEGTY